MSLIIGFKTDTGRKRENNEDSYAVLRRHELDDRLDALIVVADGMGGGRSGDIASGIVAQTLPEGVHEFLFERNGANLDTAQLLHETFVRANSKVWMRSVERKELRGMGTTCVAGIVKDNVLTLGNAGDSRAYLLREGKLRQITEDHSEVWQEVKSGNMTREEAQKSKFRNRITRAIGLSPEIHPDIEHLSLVEGDTVLFCSDGLTTEVSDSDIARVLACAPTPQEACDRLVTVALRNGGSDNVTVVVLRYGAFVPLGVLEPLPVEEEDEAPTDPQQEWRNASHYEAVVENDDDEEPEMEYVPRRRRSRPSGNEEEERAALGGGFAMTLNILLLLLVVALSAAAYISQKNRTVTVLAPNQPTGDPQQNILPKNLEYDDPVKLLDQPVRDAPLLVDADNNAYVVSDKDGRILKVAAKGKATAISPAEPEPDDATDTLRRKPKTPPVSYFAFDTNGNRYQVNWRQKCIDKFTGPTRSKQIGMGSLKNPTNVAVDHDGSLYVIDNHRLYKLAALMTLNDALEEKARKRGEDPNANE